ncbi:MAG: DNA-binding response regulator [Micavibrio sp.]|nr:DNA-binding response regulator [Micavibrio sp.]|tara:strand:- start:3516 stop:4232 length:717 start_codon:yes stop_codon:yes gene_type:complete
MRILLVDDHTLFRDALVQYLERAEPGIELAVAKDFYEAEIILSKNSQYDLVLLDFRMPGMNGHEGLRKLKAVYPDLRIALMSGVAEPNDVSAAMDIGAVGYFPKTLSGKALLQAIQLVLSGQRFMPLDENNRMMPSYYSDHPNEADVGGPGEAGGTEDGDSKRARQVRTTNDIKLTPRENEVLTYLMRGASNKEIARNLDLQEVTVKLHVRGICRKLNVKNRTQAAMHARELGLAAGH